MEIVRKFVALGTDPFSTVSYEKYDCVQKNWQTGEEKVILKGAEVPVGWSKNARDILITKYFRKAGVPKHTMPVDEPLVPQWLQRSVKDDAYEEPTGGEISVKEVVHRLVGCWTYEGLKAGYFEPTDAQIGRAQIEHAGSTLQRDDAHRKAVNINAKAFYDELVYAILHQMVAPNSPQFFNTGLWWAYGIEGKAAGNWFVDRTHKTHSYAKDDFANNTIDEHNVALRDRLTLSPNAYQKVQGHACFILGVEDSMMAENGISDWMVRESRIFKYGSGSGANVSNLRGGGEKLSSGGVSSGLLSWMRTADYNAGAIKSGGTTRRAAKMVCIDADHPDLFDFINCKVESEIAVADLVVGSKIIGKHCQNIIDLYNGTIPGNAGDGYNAVADAEEAGVPQNYIQKAIALAQQGITLWPGVQYDTHFEGKAYTMVPFQNANNSVRLSHDFYAAVDNDAIWSGLRRTDRKVAWEKPAREVEHAIATAAWFCADPGVQYDTTINDRNVTPVDGRINASNPCSEHMRLDGSGCNLGSLAIMKYVVAGANGLKKLCLDSFRHVTRLFTMVLDITNTMAHLPDRQTALGVFNYRDIGLGYAELGALVMSYGLPYDSKGAWALAGVVTAVMQGEALLTSALMAKELGAYPRFWANREHHLREIRNEWATLTGRDYEGLSVEPQHLDWNSLQEAVGHEECDEMGNNVLNLWVEAYGAGEKYGYRNAEATVIAPTGTIGILMDCDTTGVEPLFGLKVFKTLVGGTEMKYPVANCVSYGLQRLGYDAEKIEAIVARIAENGTIPRDLISTEHWPVFQTALSPEADMTIAWEAHISMMAAAQPFISGAISKTINMPGDATIDDVRRAYRDGHDLALKAVAIYRDQSKLSQPMNLAKSKKPAKLDIKDDRDQKAFLESTEDTTAPGTPAPKVDVADQVVFTSSVDNREVPPLGYATALVKQSPTEVTDRMKLPAVRTPGIDVCVGLGEGKLYLKTTKYDDGKVGEIWVTYSRDQGEFQTMLDMVAKTANVSLQHGVPLSAIIKSWRESDFAPHGLCHGHPYIKTATSILNLMAKIIAYHEYGEVWGIPDALQESAKAAWQAKQLGLDQQVTITQNIQVHARLLDLPKPDTNTAGNDSVFVGSGLEKCPDCRSKNYLPNGAGCKKCMDCGHAGGCG